MLRLTIRELMDLASSEVTSPEARIDKTFEWDNARRLELAKWLLTVAGALFVPVAIAFVRGETGRSSSPWWLIGALFFSVLLAAFGIGTLFRARKVQHVYIATQTLLGEITKIAAFLATYRDATQQRR